jgi:O-antigen biosynthesis protein
MPIFHPVKLKIPDELVKVVRKSFDAGFYRTEYLDIGNNVDLFEHYLRVGWLEGRNPCNWFDGISYLDQNQDVKNRGFNPFVHFLGWGLFEGRRFKVFPSPSVATRIAFDQVHRNWVELLKPYVNIGFYRKQLGAMGDLQFDLVAHYAYRGWREGLSPSADFVPTNELAELARLHGINPIVCGLIDPYRETAKTKSGRNNSAPRTKQPAALHSRPPLLTSTGELLPSERVAAAYTILTTHANTPVGIRLTAEPIHEIVRQSDGSFLSLGIDPQFRVTPPEDVTLKGWYELELKISAREVMTPTLYVALSPDWRKFWEVPIGVTRNRKAIKKIIFIPSESACLRLDPSDHPGPFELSEIKLTPLNGADIFQEVTSRANIEIAQNFLDSTEIALRVFENDIWSPPVVKGGDVSFHGRSHQDWVRLFSTPQQDDIFEIKESINALARRPIISIVMPVFNTPEFALRAAIDSVRGQLYPHWELCVVDDASTLPTTRATLEEYLEVDSRIKVGFREENGNIAAASNDALSMCVGEYIAFMDHDDIIWPHALAYVAMVIARNPNIKFIYTDEDKIDEKGNRYDPHFKSGWNYELLLNQNYINHFSVFRQDVIRSSNGFRPGFEGSQDYDLLLRSLHGMTGAEIYHLPYILYSWRVFDQSGSFSQSKGRRAKLASMLALSDHSIRAGINGDVIEPSDATFRIKRRVADPKPLVSLIIPTRDRADLLRQCVLGILRETSYPNLELVIVDNESVAPSTHEFFDEISKNSRVKIVQYKGAFNFSAMNNYAVGQSAGTYIGFINNDIKIIKGDWLEELMGYAVEDRIGAVGAKLLYENDTIQHAGIIVGLGGVAGHSHKHRQRGDPGYFRRLQLPQYMSAVTAACLIMRRSVFEQVNGFNETDLTVAFNDVDLCLRIGEVGYDIVMNPYAVLYHLESVSRGPDTDPDKVQRFGKEIAYMKERWGNRLLNDPFYNPNLTLDREDFSIAWPPRAPSFPL